MNTIYMGDLFLGTYKPGSKAQDQSTSVIFDTGSNWLVVESDLCIESNSCEDIGYYAFESTSFFKLSEEVFNQTYGSAYIEGIPAMDHICVYPRGTPDNACIDNMKFMAITS